MRVHLGSAAATLVIVILTTAAGMVLAPAARGQEMLANLHLVGTVERTGKAPAFKVGDPVKVIEEKGGAVAATGSVVAQDGTFFVEMTMSAKYNGTPLALQIVVDGEAFPLKDGKDVARFAYKGTFPFPNRVTKAVYYGDGVPTGKAPPAAPASAAAPAGGGAKPAKAAAPVPTCPATLPKCDADGDGHFSQKDIDFIKTQLTVKQPDRRGDLNGDGMVNSMDLVAGIRELNVKH